VKRVLMFTAVILLGLTTLVTPALAGGHRGHYRKYSKYSGCGARGGRVVYQQPYAPRYHSSLSFGFGVPLYAPAAVYYPAPVYYGGPAYYAPAPVAVPGAYFQVWVPGHYAYGAGGGQFWVAGYWSRGRR